MDEELSKHDPHLREAVILQNQPQYMAAGMFNLSQGFASGLTVSLHHVFPQTVCLNGFKMTLVAFEELKWIGACHSSQSSNPRVPREAA